MGAARFAAYGVIELWLGAGALWPPPHVGHSRCAQAAGPHRQWERTQESEVISRIGAQLHVPEATSAGRLPL